MIARERNIDVTEVKNDPYGDFQSLVRLAIETDRNSHTVAGALFGATP